MTVMFTGMGPCFTLVFICVTKDSKLVLQKFCSDSQSVVSQLTPSVRPSVRLSVLQSVSQSISQSVRQSVSHSVSLVTGSQ